jgi:hypothetical protein
MSSRGIGRSMRRRLGLAAALSALGFAAAAAPRLEAQSLERPRASEGKRFYPDDPLWRDPDMRDIPPVAKFDLSKSYEFVHETFGDTAASRGRALNVNTLDEVPDSSWFTNRLGRRDMTVGEVVRGPDQVDGPAPGTWYVSGRPNVGITPKFTIRDARGDTYLVKLDPEAFAELPSSVELISTKIFHAIGYHVPEDFVVTFDLARLDVAPGAKMRTPKGDRRPIRMSDVKEWLKDVPRTADGRIRALVSRYVPGKVVGQFRYTGTRPDDPNDIYPHERRRELRALRVFAAWLNHDDARSLNSIDTYVEDGGSRYIRHYLQDFGSNLGSGSTSAQQPRGGNEYLIEGDKIVKGLFSFGLWNRSWTRVRYPGDPSLGNIEADFFSPEKWKTEYPQPAFDQMDDADAFWGATIASRFTDEMIRAVVAAGRLSNPAAERRLGDVIIRRRDKVVAYWITRTNPLDSFEVRAGGAGTELVFDNAAVRLGLAQPGGSYRVRWSALDNGARSELPSGAEVEAAESRVAIPGSAWGPADDAGIRYATASIRSMYREFPGWERAVVVTVRNRAGALDVVGIERPADPVVTR